MKMITTADLHEWLDKVTPDCNERKLLHLLLVRLVQYEAGQVPELKPVLTDSARGDPCTKDRDI